MTTVDGNKMRGRSPEIIKERKNYDTEKRNLSLLDLRQHDRGDQRRCRHVGMLRETYGETGRNEADASFEKHVPVVEKMSGGYRVRVGSLSHPMTEGHYIQWIELMTKKKVLRHELTPDDMPEATFLTDEEMVCARAYCNLHGLWIKK